MKHIPIWIAVLLLMFCGISVTAEEPDYTLKIPDGFTAASRSDDKTALAGILGYEPKDLAKRYEEDGLLTVAADSTAAKHFRLACNEGDFSRSAVSFSRLSDTELQKIASDLTSKTETFRLVTGKDKNRYICLSGQYHDERGDYFVTEYITVCSSKLYTLSITVKGNDEKQNDSFSKKVFDGLSIRDNSAPKVETESTLHTVLFAIGIAAFAAIIVILSITVIRDLRKK